MLSMKKVLITGTAGFIGHFMALRLINEGHEVIGLDNINDYYDPSLKFARLNEAGIDEREAREFGKVCQSRKHPHYRFVRVALEDQDQMAALFERERPQIVIHLAAQAGVRYSLENPFAYTKSNIDGTLTILEGCRHHPVEHLIMASSSSVYGMNEKVPFQTTDEVNDPVSLYAVTKRANELMASNYAHLFKTPITCLRFFTVYGPWGRPDMALFKFTKAILEGREIEVFNNGDLSRDFTYIDDIIESITRLIPLAPTTKRPYALYNIGNNSPVKLLDFIKALEEKTGREAIKKMMPMQPGDVYQTWADVSDLNAKTGFAPKTPLIEGVGAFVEWYRQFYR